MHIKDLTTDTELDTTALAAVRGGCFALDAKACGGYGQPELPTPATDWTTFNAADVKAYISGAKAGVEFPSFDIGNQGTPEIAAPAYSNLPNI